MTQSQRQIKRDSDNRYYASEKGTANRERKLVANLTLEQWDRRKSRDRIRRAKKVLARYQ